MGSRYHWPVVVLAALVSCVAAQGKSIIPQDIQAGFNTDGDQVQVSFTGQAVNGFSDGTVFEKNAVAKEPTFALGDSNGISPTTLYTIIMVDTTCANARRLHYARANFKNNFDITNIATESPAIVDYVAPGSVGEKGNNRQYSFLMYTNPDRKEITSLKLPGKNEVFDIKKFQDDNGLQNAEAGVGMVVKLGGEANCENGGASESPSNSSTPVSTPNSTSSATRAVSRTSAAASTTRSADAEVPQSTVTPSPIVSGSGGQRNGTSVSRPRPSRSPASSAVSSSVALPPETPEPSETPGRSNPSNAPVSNPSRTGTATSTANPAQQTANAASRGFRKYNCEIAALVLALGVLIV